MGNQQILKKANSALLEGNYDKFITYCSEEVKWENVGESTLVGKAELLSYVSSAYEGVTFTTENYIEQQDFVVEMGQIVFKKNGELKQSSYCDVWRFSNGLISQLTSFVIEKAP